MRLHSSFSILSLLLLAGLSGCTASTPGAIDRWAVRQGGIVDGAPAAIARCALLEVQQAAGDFHLSDARLSIAVLDSDRPVAYAWPCGRIFVSTGLIDLLSREELVAAIAHEIGHLTSDPAPEAGVALSGDFRHEHDACEVAADRAGRALLQRAGLPDVAMVTMLNKVAASPHTPSAVRPLLERRAALLSSH